MSEPFIGEIKMFGGNYAPQNYAMCWGGLMAIAQNAALFSILGTTFGGDGQTTFGLPDLRGRMPIGWGAGPGLSSVVLGEIGGRENISLTTDQMPAHTHLAQSQIKIPAVSASTAVTGTPAENTILGPIVAAGRPGTLYSTDAANTTLAPFANTVTVATTGGSTPVDISNPFLGVTFIIALVGVYPPHS